MSDKNSLECVQRYEEWASSYDEDGLKQDYNGAKILVDICLEFIQNKEDRILDLCAGTGTTAELLNSHGYRNIDGHDGSKKMLEIAKNRNVYKQIFEEIFQPGVHSPIIKEAQYDAVIGVGLFSPTLMGANYMEHLIRPAKTGGMIIFGMNQEFFDEFDKMSTLERLQSDNILCLVKKIGKPNYIKQKPGLFFVFKKL